jgi:hypothetical protein
MKPMGKGAAKLVKQLLDRPEVQKAMVASGTAVKGSPLYEKVKKKYGTPKDSMGRQRYGMKSSEPDLNRKV